MSISTKSIVVSAAFIVLSSMLTGCGGESGGNAPSVKLTASSVVSEPWSGHVHNVLIPLTDISAASATNTFQYRSSDNSGHTHVIALSKDQITDLNNGMRITISSSAPSSGTAHTHTWNIVGGNVLYDKYCYNCHTNDKRGQNPMKVFFNLSQTNAVKSPASAPLSTSAAPVPDPNFAPSTVVSLDGVLLYASNCSTSS